MYVPEITDSDMEAAIRARMNAGSTEQVLSVTDVISEGPIQGLVFGGKSIFLNDDSLFADSEIGVTSTTGLSISSADPATATITINNYKDAEFDYSPSPGQLGTRFLLIHNLYNFVNTAGSTTIAYNSTSAPAANNQQTGFELVLDGDFSSLPNAVTTTRRNIRQSAFDDGNGIVEVWSESGDRFVSGMILQRGADNIKIALSTKNLENSSWITQSGANLTVRVSELRKINNITDNTITLATAPSKAFTNSSFSISSPIYTSSNGVQTRNYDYKKIPSSGYQFRPGTVDQDPIENLSGDAGVNTVALPVSSVAKLDTGAPKSIVYTGDAAAEIDSVRLIFRYNAGLYLLNKDTGDKEGAGAAYVIRIFTQNEDGVTFTDRGFYKGDTTVGDELRKQFITNHQGAPLSVTSPTVLQLGTQGGLWVPMADLDANSSSPEDSIVTSNNQTFVDVLDPQNTFIKHGGKHLSGVTFTHTINLRPYQPYSGFKIVVVRITNSENNTEDGSGRAHGYPNIGFRHSDNTYQGIHSGGISQALGVITDRVHYPYTAVANVTFNTRQFTSMPSRNYECYGMKVLVPDNYMPREEFGLITAEHTNLTSSESVGSFPDAQRLYGQHTFKDGTSSATKFFTGTFRKEKVYTDNPAWVFHDMLVNDRYGLGEFVKDIDIDIFSLYKVARYCDELVPDGNGGFEPRFRANLYLTKATDCYKVLKDMATIFRGMLYWMDGKLTAVMDEKKAPVYTFNKSNVVEGQFEYEQTGSKTRKNQIVVTWNNPKNEYKREPLFVEDRENIVKTGKVVKGKALAFGCTSRGQAVRYGRWKLWTSINQTEVVAFKTAINAVFLAPGDVINVQDNHDYGFNYGGRVVNITKSSGVSTITLDRNLGETLDGSSIAQNIISSTSPTFKLSLLLAEKTVVLNEGATVGNVTYDTGDTISSWKDADNVTVTVDQSGSGTNGAWTEEDFEKFTRDAYGDNGTLLNLSYTTGTRVKEVSCSETEAQIAAGTSVLTTTELSDSEKESALHGKIWALKDDANNPTEASYKQYKILSIVNDEDNLYNIAAAEYHPEKFDSIETNFSPTLDDPLFPIDGPKSKLEPPQGLRVLRMSNMDKPGEELVIQWAPPENSENVVEYEVTTGIPGRPGTEMVTDTTLAVDEVPDGSYTIVVRTRDARGRTSEPATTVITIEDFYSGTHPRIFGLLKGGITNTRSVISTGPGQANKKFKFATNPVVLYSPRETKDTGQNVTVDGLDYSLLSQYRANPSQFPWWVTNTGTLLNDEAFVVIKNYNSSIQSSRHLVLANHVTDTKGSVDYWYDQILQIKKTYNENEPTLNFPDNPDIWLLQNGVVTIENESSKVTGSAGSNFTSLNLTNVLKFADDKMARISLIESDEVMYIDRSFSYKTNTITGANVNGSTGVITYETGEDHSFQVGDIVTISGLTGNGGSVVNYDSARITEVLPNSGDPTIFTKFRINKTTIGTGATGNGTVTDAITSKAYYKDQLSLDFRKDFILGKLSHNGNFRSFLTTDPDITGIRDALVDSNVTFIRYEENNQGTISQLTNSSGALLYSNITLEVRPISFDNPEFKITGTGFDSVSGTADSDFVDGNTDGIYIREVDNAGNPVPYSNGEDLEFTVEVREKSDHTQLITKTFSILKVKDGASGSQGFTASINAEDYSVVYDDIGRNPSHNGTSGTIVITADAFNFIDPLFRFTDPAGSVGVWTDPSGTQATTNFSVPTTFTSGVFASSSSAVFKVEVAEKPDGWTTSTAQSVPIVSATDSISIAKIKEGTGGLAVVNSNMAHVISTDKFGNVEDTNNDGKGPAPGSGTTFEVFGGGNVLTYVGNTGSTGKPSGTNLAANQWYIKDVDPAGGDITLGTLSVDTNTNIVTIGDHEIHNSDHSTHPSENTEVIKYVIEAKVGERLVTADSIQSLSKSITGKDGAVRVELYYRNNNSSGPGINAPAAATFSFADSALANFGNDWLEDQPSPTSTQKFVWKIAATVSDDLSGNAITIPQTYNQTTAPMGWKTASLVAQFASPGDNARAVRLKQSTSIIRYDKDDSTTIESGTATSVNFAVDLQGPDNLPTGIKLSFLVDGVTIVDKGSVNTTGGFATATQFTLPVAGNANAVLPTIATDPVKNVTVQMFEPINGVDTKVAEDTVSIYAVNSGADSITPFLTNQVHVEPADSDGHLIDALHNPSGRIINAGGVFKIFKAGAFITSGVTFSVVGSATVGGLTADIASNGAYTLTPAANSLSGWTTRSATFTFRATVDNKNFDLEYTINKSIEGQKGDDAVFLTASHVSFSKASSGNLFTPSGTSTVVLNTGDNTVTGISFAVAFADASKCSVSGSNTATETVTFNDISETNAQSGATIVCSFTLNGVASSRSIKIPTTVHGLQGSNGAKTVSGHIYFTTTSASFSYSGGTATFNTTTGLVTTSTVSGVPAGASVSNTPPTINPTAATAQYYFVSTYSGTEDLTDNTVTVSIGAAVAYFNFNGIVTFTNNSDGNAVLSEAGASNTLTAIDGGNIATGTIQAQKLEIGQVPTDSSGNAESAYIKIENDKVVVKVNNQDRVVLGKIS